MRRFFSGIVAALTFATIAIAGAAPASAATITFEYELDGTESTWERVDGTAVPCRAPYASTHFYYRTGTLTVDTDGDYTFWDTSWDNWDENEGHSDGFIAIYSAFDPATPTSGCLIAVDDNHEAGFAIGLTAGTTYTIVQTTFSPLSTGTFLFSVSGPGTVRIGVPLADTTTTVAATPNPALVGDTVTLTATVTGDNPTGDVEFYGDGELLGTAPIIDGVATLPLTGLAAGSFEITAAYGGDAANANSSTDGPVTLTVNPVPVDEEPEPEPEPDGDPTPPKRVETAA